MSLCLGPLPKTLSAAKEHEREFTRQQKDRPLTVSRCSKSLVYLATRSTPRAGVDAIVGQTGPRERHIKLKFDLQIDTRLVLLGLYLGGLLLRLHS